MATDVSKSSSAASRRGSAEGVSGKTMPLDEYRALVGSEIGCSRWIEVPQAMIDGFADLTGDHQFIHVDPVAAAATPFGGTISHGFLTVALLAPMSRDVIPAMEGSSAQINYGMDNLRFIAPVRSGSRIRGRFTLRALEPRGVNHLAIFRVTVEIEHEEKPALNLEWQIFFQFRG